MPGSRHPAAKSTRRMMTPGSRHTTAKSTQHLLLAWRVNFLVKEKLMYFIEYLKKLIVTIRYKDSKPSRAIRPLYLSIYE